jgi:hypothetical protein
MIAITNEWLFVSHNITSWRYCDANSHFVSSDGRCRLHQTNDGRRKQSLIKSRRESPIEIHHSNTLKRRIGNTTYKIKVYLSETASETFEDKLLRLVSTDSALHGESEHEAQED